MGFPDRQPCLYGAKSPVNSRSFLMISDISLPDGPENSCIAIGSFLKAGDEMSM